MKQGFMIRFTLSILVFMCQIGNTFGFARVISLTAASGPYSDETVIRLENQSTFSFDSDWDAYKLTNGGSTPNFYTTLDNTLYSINSVPMTFEEYTFNLDLKVAFTGNYTITIKSLLNSQDSTLVIVLEDQLLQTTQIVSENYIYQFSASVNDSPDRFLLHYRFIQPIQGSLISGFASGPDPGISNGMIDIKFNSGQIQVDFKDTPSNYATIGIISSDGKAVYLNENVSTNSSTVISLKQNPGSIYIIRVHSGNNRLYKKIYY